MDRENHRPLLILGTIFLLHPVGVRRQGYGWVGGMAKQRVGEEKSDRFSFFDILCGTTCGICSCNCELNDGAAKG